MNITLGQGHLEVISTLRELHAEAYGLSSDDSRQAALNAEIYKLSDSLAVAISALVGNAISPPVPHVGTAVSQTATRYPLYLEAEQLQRIKELLNQASSREADPESPIFQILDEVRAARRRIQVSELPMDRSSILGSA